VPLKALQITIAVAMIGVAIFSLLNKNLGHASHEAPASNVAVIAGLLQAQTGDHPGQEIQVAVAFDGPYVLKITVQCPALGMGGSDVRT
jgi:hypothetical protein